MCEAWLLCNVGVNVGSSEILFASKNRIAPNPTTGPFGIEVADGRGIEQVTVRIGGVVYVRQVVLGGR
jgi:hypothetical protein